VTGRGGTSSRATGRATTLRSRWNRAFAVLFIALALVGVVGLAGAHAIGGGFRATAERVEADASRLSRVRADMATQVNLGHGLMEQDDGVDGGQAAALETSIRATIDHAARRAHNSTERRLLQGARDQWERGIAEIRRYDRSGSVEARTAAHLALADHGREAAELLDAAGAAGRAADRAQLSRAQRTEQHALAAMAVLSLAVCVLVIRSARRLSVDVLRPVADLRDSADRLAAGELGHRAAVHGSDELADLAISFNAMADAIACSHRSLTHQAHHDALTGLANRAGFVAHLEEAISRPGGGEDLQAVLFVDLDDFKDVNDALGHAAGDELLQVVAVRLADAVRPDGLVARLGGDEFAVLLDGVTERAALAAAERAVAALDRPVELVGAPVHVSASIGLAVSHGGRDPGSLMREADVAMYTAKVRGKNRIERYDAALHQATVEHQALKTEVMGAAGRGELVVDYQPIVALTTGELIGVEALVRWRHPTRGLLLPSEFITVAEDTGAIVEIGAWVLDASLRQLCRWKDVREGAPLSVSVNVSARQLGVPGFAEQVDRLLRSIGLDPSRLVLEVTESVLVDRAGRAATTLEALRRLGVRIAIDDFGTGYASIGYLQELPVDILKIDRSFISGERANRRGDALLKAVIGLGKQLGLEIISEGIEEPAQISRLRALGCRAGQGFLLSRPVSPTVIDELLASSVSLLPTAVEARGAISLFSVAAG
jgi:diguanylate cyclase (GGDEF)-like protein